MMKLLLLAAFIALNSSANCQDSISCSDLQHGVFHYYTINTGLHGYIVRDGDSQIENDGISSDTTLWKVHWTGECSYTEQYLSGSKNWTEQQLSFMNKHILHYEIKKISNDYYIARETLDKKSGLYIGTDTMWFHEKTNHLNDALIQQYSPAELAEGHFNDSSHYALLFIYRPGKFTNSLGFYPIYFADNLICIGRNKTGYIFKVLREGNFTIDSRLYKDKSSVDINIHFGQIYYVKSMIHWTVSSRLYNFKLEMALMDKGLGKKEFNEIRLQ